MLSKKIFIHQVHDLKVTHVPFSETFLWPFVTDIQIFRNFLLRDDIFCRARIFFFSFQLFFRSPKIPVRAFIAFVPFFWCCEDFGRIILRQSFRSKIGSKFWSNGSRSSKFYHSGRFSSEKREWVDRPMAQSNSLSLKFHQSFFPFPGSYLCVN